MGDIYYNNYKEFLDEFEKIKKGEKITISQMRRKVEISFETIKKYFKRLEEEGKAKIYFENGRIKNIEKL